MLIAVDSHSGVPVYRQIIDQVRFQIAAGLVKAGTELPSTRTLSQELGVNPMTVSKAYGLLEEEGVVMRRPGLPLVVSEQSEEAETRTKAAHLRLVLEPVAVAARQLGITDEQAIEVFRQTLADTVLEEERRA